MLRRLRHLSITAKLTSLIAITSLSLVLIAMGSMIINELVGFHQNRLQQLNDLASALAASTAAHIAAGDRLAANAQLRSVAQTEPVSTVALYDRQRVLFTHHPDSGAISPALPTSLAPNGSPAYSLSGRLAAYARMLHKGELSVTQAVFLHGQVVGAVLVSSTTQELGDAILGYLRTGATISFAAIVISLLISRKLQRSLCQPLLHLDRVIEEISQSQNYSLRGHATTRDELGTLIDKFNTMLDTIEHRDRLLTEYNAQLEHRVAAQMQALTQTKEEFAAALAQSARAAEITKTNDQGKLVPTPSPIATRETARQMATSPAETADPVPLPQQSTTNIQPLRPVRHTSLQSNGWTPSERLMGLRILVVDASPAQRETLSAHLYSWNMLCDVAGDAAMTLSALKRALSQGQPYDLLIVTRDGLDRDGLALARLIRRDAALRDLRIMLISPPGDQASAEEAGEAQISAQIVKPVKLSQLYEKVAAAFGETDLNPLPTEVALSTATPAPMPAAVSVSSPTTTATSATLTGRVLVTVPPSACRDDFLGMLRALGLTVMTAANGWDVLTMLDRAHFDLLLLDSQMPELDGLRTAAILRRREVELQVPLAEGGPYPRRLPIVALVTDTTEDHRQSCLAAGMDDCITIPTDQHNIAQTLADWLKPSTNSSRPGASSPRLSPGQLPSLPNQTSGTPKHTTEYSTMTSPGSDAVLDQQALNNIRALQRPGSRVFEKVVGIYLKDCPSTIAELESALRAGDPTRISQLAHRLKSGSANLGAITLAGYLRDLEAIGRGGSCDGAEELLGQVKNEYAKVEAALRHELQLAMVQQSE